MIVQISDLLDLRRSERWPTELNAAISQVLRDRVSVQRVKVSDSVDRPQGVVVRHELIDLGRGEPSVRTADWPGGPPVLGQKLSEFASVHHPG